MQDQPMQEVNEPAAPEQIPTNNPPPKRNFTNIIVAVAAVIVGIILIVILQKSSLQADQISDETDDQATTSEHAQDTKEPMYNFEYDLIADWAEADRALDDIQELTRGQELEFSVLTDPEDDKFVYFATSVYDSRQKENLVGIYKYNNENYTFERLFRRSYSQDDFSLLASGALPNFYVAGYADGKLILLAAERAYEPHECNELLLVGTEGEENAALVSMSLADPYSGFVEYEPREEDLAAATKREQTCK